ncbi:30S ribosomal protein S8 [Citrus sinensis]|uniref:30S ribosomal protein S8 n=1 Tax=Citrus sinensis TaxID=2711 RepID=A0ACB8JTS1_CITSI|nr:30S ribosomal protein S8 [Citrus sinensis]
MGKDTIADIITSIRNADMNRKGTVRIASTNITENVVKILLREGFIENARKLVENKNKKEFLVLTLQHLHQILYGTAQILTLSNIRGGETSTSSNLIWRCPDFNPLKYSRRDVNSTLGYVGV